MSVAIEQGPAASRKGARRLTDVTEELRASLEAGLPSATHIEQMAIRMDRLLASEFPLLVDHPGLAALERCGFVHKMRLMGAILADAFGDDAAGMASESGSDTVRGWGAFAAAEVSDHDQHVQSLQVFAEDPHFSVREMAWLALRPTACQHTEMTIRCLAPLALERSPFLRRFASEATRPRGVWSTHITTLKANPELARKILDPLRADPSRYVRRSVGNWLNDAAKDNPTWVGDVLSDWRSADPPVASDVMTRARVRVDQAEEGVEIEPA